MTCCKVRVSGNSSESSGFSFKFVLLTPLFPTFFVAPIPPTKSLLDTSFRSSDHLKARRMHKVACVIQRICDHDILHKTAKWHRAWLACHIESQLLYHPWLLPLHGMGWLTLARYLCNPTMLRCEVRPRTLGSNMPRIEKETRSSATRPHPSTSLHIPPTQAAPRGGSGRRGSARTQRKCSSGPRPRCREGLLNAGLCRAWAGLFVHACPPRLKVVPFAS